MSDPIMLCDDVHDGIMALAAASASGTAERAAAHSQRASSAATHARSAGRTSEGAKSEK